MRPITTMFWDLGGVVLTNAWDREQRIKVLNSHGITEKHHLDEFGDRHREVAAGFEIGHYSLDEYLDMTLFDMHHIAREPFKESMFAQSESLPGMDVLAEVVQTGRCFMATLNNESLPLNEYRIARFKLKQYFQVFCSSCYLGVTKPTKEIYETALHITHNKPEECVFIDDREQNAEAAKKLGIHAIHYKNPDQLRKELRFLKIID